MAQQTLDTVGSTDSLQSGGNKINSNFNELYAHSTSTANPHGVTKTHVGLGNVDDTSDATKNSAVATLSNKTIVDITESSPTPNTATIDLAVGTVFNFTAATAIVLPAVAAGKSFTVVSSVAIPSTNWTGTIQWAGGAAPTPTAGTGCVFAFIANADATAWIGTQSIDGAA